MNNYLIFIIAFFLSIRVFCDDQEMLDLSKCSVKRFDRWVDSQISYSESNLSNLVELQMALIKRLKASKLISKQTLVKSLDYLIGVELEQVMLAHRLYYPGLFNVRKRLELDEKWCDDLIAIVEEGVLPSYGVYSDIAAIMNFYLFQIYRVRGSEEDKRKAISHLKSASNLGRESYLSFLRGYGDYKQKLIYEDKRLSAVAKIKKLARLYAFLFNVSGNSPKEIENKDFNRKMLQYIWGVNYAQDEIKKKIYQLAKENDLFKHDELKWLPLFLAVYKPN